MNNQMFLEEEQRSHERFCLIADKIEVEPSLLRIPLANVDRWLGRDHAAKKRLLEWRELIVAAMASQPGLIRLLDLLRADDEETRFFKGFAPFPGVLTASEAERFLS